MPHYRFGKNQPPHHRWPIAWYNPMVLARSLREMVSTGDQIRNLDRREMYPVNLELIRIADSERDGDFWWDFVSDTGDGGNATYTVAREMQKPALPRQTCPDIDSGGIPDSLPMGELLVLGGDLAYPGASVEEYQYRLSEMWTAAAPQPCADTPEPEQLRPSLAIPQNHDWFDNISTFHRYFVRTSSDPEALFTPLSTRKLQRQSYFAARLPNHWVILGFDFALVGDIDHQQYLAFKRLLGYVGTSATDDRITTRDNLILLYPEPYWIRDLGDSAREGYPKRYQRLEAYLHDNGFHVRVRLAGDIHHYARESASADGEQSHDLLLIAGGGGAFLHPTHSIVSHQNKLLSTKHEAAAMTPDLERRVRLGISTRPPLSNERVYDQRHHYPTPAQSRALLGSSWKAFFRPAGRGGGKRRLAALLQGNLMFSVMVGALFSIIAVTGFWPAGLLLMALYTGISLERSRWLPWTGCLLGLGLALLATYLPGSLQTYLPLENQTYDWLITLLVSFPLGIVLGGLVTGIYFAACSWFGHLPNNSFSHLGYEGYKSFLRFRIDREGNLHGYLWGADKVPDNWKDNPQLTFPLWMETHPEEAARWEIKDHFVLRSHPPEQPQS